jgi:hypothetical protein
MGTIQQDKDTLNGSPFLYEQPFAIGGHVKCSILNLKGSSSYATGGDTLTPQMFGFGPKGLFLFLFVSETYSGTYRLEPIYPQRGPNSSVKVVFTVESTDAEVANATDLSAEKFRAVAFAIQ